MNQKNSKNFKDFGSAHECSKIQVLDQLTHNLHSHRDAEE